MTQDLDRLDVLAAAANITKDRPWDLYCNHDENVILQNHTMFGGHSDEEWGPCRITTGPDFDEHAAAEFVEAVVNAYPDLRDAVRERDEARLAIDENREAYREQMEVVVRERDKLREALERIAEGNPIDECTDLREWVEWAQTDAYAALHREDEA